MDDYVVIIALQLKETSNNIHFESDNNEFKILRHGDINASISMHMHVHVRLLLLVLREK